MCAQRKVSKTECSVLWPVLERNVYSAPLYHGVAGQYFTVQLPQAAGGREPPCASGHGQGCCTPLTGHRAAIPPTARRSAPLPHCYRYLRRQTHWSTPTSQLARDGVEALAEVPGHLLQFVRRGLRSSLEGGPGGPALPPLFDRRYHGIDGRNLFFQDKFRGIFGVFTAVYNSVEELAFW